MGLIVFTGHKGSGKDTATAGISGRYQHMKFADPLKDMLRTMFRYMGIHDDTIEDMVEGALKELPAEQLFGHTPRHAMQTLGTEWRNMIDPNLWVAIAVSRIEQWFSGNRGIHPHGIIITDLRFKHELAALRQFRPVVIRVNRPDLVVDLSHPSEREIPELEVDFEILNNGTIAELREQIKEITRYA